MPCWFIDERSWSLSNVNIQISLLLKGWHHFQGVNFDMTQLLSELQSSRPLIGKNNSQNKIYMSWVNNDYVCQGADTICYKHNICLSPQWLEKWCQENMNLFTQNMELDIPSNGSKRIPNYIMCSNVLFPMRITK